MWEKEILQEQINEASQEIKTLLVNRTWSGIVDEISQKNNFSPEQKTSLENEVLFVFLRMELLSNFSQNLQANLNIPELLAKEIFQEIYEKLFKQVESLLPTEIEPEPIIITKETKEEAIKELDRRTLEREKLQPGVPEIKPDIHPMIEPGEVVRDAQPESRRVNQKSGIKPELEKPDVSV